MLKVFRAMRRIQKIHIHQMLGVIIVVAHASEIVRVVSHITLWHLLVAILLFSVWLLTQNEDAEELA